MPKIFLIKNRLHQQQLRLAEAQKRADGPADGSGISLSPPGSPLSYQDAQPLPLIVSKDNGEPPSRSAPTAPAGEEIPRVYSAADGGPRTLPWSGVWLPPASLGCAPGMTTFRAPRQPDPAAPGSNRGHPRSPSTKGVAPPPSHSLP
ncbi:hypothetical protein ONE63_005417 [Megalurothrips usitatus]|uniref:Uncharacterized protein n=1 Tax=Megalurothrips usitatus TaxID=439358 RepID=A0AAV7XZA0_9NEOP|nr:hypothetical protein ONE63_005417 [Megalurothrips usitatus]